MTIILSDLKQQRSWLTGAVGEGGVARGNLKHTCIAALHDQRDTVCTCQASLRPYSTSGRLPIISDKCTYTS